MDNKKINEIMNQIFVEMCETKKEGNVVLSPVSIVMMLAVVAVTANGATRDEIVKALGGERYYDMIKELSSLQKQLTRGKGFSSANAVCINDQLKDAIVPGISDRLKSLLGEVFCTNDMVKAVNDWVSEKTNGMISELVDESAKDMGTCIMNAVYFSGEWAEKYGEHCTYPSEFNSFSKGKEHVQMLESSEKSYIENDLFTGFVKDYSNGYAYMGLLPKRKGITALNEAVKNMDFNFLYESSIAREVLVDMPEFETSLDENITDLCEKLGVRRMFTEQADFSNLSTVPIVFDQALHKAKIKVNRAGTVAAAATAVCDILGLEIPEEETKEVVLNRPFVYAIISKKTGLPVFAGIQEHVGE